MITSLTGTTGGFALLSIHHVQLAIPRSGKDQCRAFWGDVLGMGELDKPPFGNRPEFLQPQSV